MIHKHFWRRGFATEVVQYCLELGFNQFKFQEIVALTTPANIASQKVITKLGLTFDENLISFRGTTHLIARASFLSYI